MRRLFLPALIASVAVFVLLVLSLFTFLWTSADGATRVGLSQGCLNFWHGQPGDFGGRGANLSIHGWSGDAIIWRPEIDSKCKVWVAAAKPSVPGGSVPVRQIVGTSIMLPVLYPLVLTALAGGVSFLPWRRHRRTLRNECPRCRYDQRGLISPRCPECGTILRRFLARLFRRSAAHA